MIVFKKYSFIFFNLYILIFTFLELTPYLSAQQSIGYDTVYVEVPVAIIKGYLKIEEDKFNPLSQMVVTADDKAYMDVSALIIDTSIITGISIIARLSPYFERGSHKGFLFVDLDTNGYMLAYRQIDKVSKQTIDGKNYFDFEKVYLKRDNPTKTEFKIIEIADLPPDFFGQKKLNETKFPILYISIMLGIFVMINLIIANKKNKNLLVFGLIGLLPLIGLILAIYLVNKYPN